ncbi:MAG: undecaprenyl-diphosphate phosphatase [Treponema sp.]|jgi:undecaprenyl-diphosphatase|nr:undecaprenyl-diphosphate phosphatase [Treponema sp.]
MRVWEALILGIVQGATEFLPVSSSGHLVLLQRIFGIQEPALVFDTAVHGGTMIAVIAVLRRDIWSILSRIFQPLTLHLIIATIPAVAAALFFKSSIEDAFTSASFLGPAFLVTSILLFISDKRLPPGPQTKGSDNMNIVDALVIGLFQAVAVVPGISRSGATISAALFRRLDRDFAARFSFLLSIPAIAGALVLQIRELAGTSANTVMEPIPLAVGTLSACIVAFFSIHLALKIVRERSLLGFALYTGILGLLVLADKLVLHFFF